MQTVKIYYMTTRGIKNGITLGERSQQHGIFNVNRV